MKKFLLSKIINFISLVLILLGILTIIWGTRWIPGPPEDWVWLANWMLWLPYWAYPTTNWGIIFGGILMTFLGLVVTGISIFLNLNQNKVSYENNETNL